LGAGVVCHQTRFDAMDVQPKQAFYLTTYDESTMCVVEHQRFEANLTEVTLLLDMPPGQIVGAGLEPSQAKRLANFLGLSISAPYTYAQLQAPHFVDRLPYTVHTNREFVLMARGTKPLAVFSEGYPLPYPSPYFAEEKFDEQVAARRFVKREYVVPFDKNQGPGPSGPVRGVRVILYSQASEEWRIDAYVLLRNTSVKAGFGEFFERQEGALLGYEEWQNDAYIELVKATKANPEAF
jgi:hypothetical protein